MKQKKRPKFANFLVLLFFLSKNVLTNALEAQDFLKEGWTLEPLAASKSINLGEN